MIRVVIDTNVLVSGMLSPRGNEALVLLAVAQGLIKPCFSQEILEEYVSVLGRPKFSFPQKEVRSLLGLLHEQGEVLQPQRSEVVSPDPEDTKFLECAARGQADFLVTGNKRHFPASPYGFTWVVSAAELIVRITLDL